MLEATASTGVGGVGDCRLWCGGSAMRPMRHRLVAADAVADTAAGWIYVQASTSAWRRLQSATGVLAMFSLRFTCDISEPYLTFSLTCNSAEMV